jgi:hypothetical protein
MASRCDSMSLSNRSSSCLSALVAEWFAAVGDIVQRYMSGRRGDDPAPRRQVVIVTKIRWWAVASGRNIWMVLFALVRVTVVVLASAPAFSGATRRRRRVHQ